MSIVPADPHEPISREQWAELEAAWPDARRLWRALALAPTIRLCEALLDGEAVPLADLDGGWVARLGLRRAA